MPARLATVIGAPAFIQQESDHRHRLLRARRQRPSHRTTEQRYELAASHCPMLPVLPTERIAHLGTVDCCTIHLRSTRRSRSRGR